MIVGVMGEWNSGIMGEEMSVVELKYFLIKNKISLSNKKSLLSF
jgi:hypothetical protein